MLIIYYCFNCIQNFYKNIKKRVDKVGHALYTE